MMLVIYLLNLIRCIEKTLVKSKDLDSAYLIFKNVNQMEWARDKSKATVFELSRNEDGRPKTLLLRKDGKVYKLHPEVENGKMYIKNHDNDKVLTTIESSFWGEHIVLAPINDKLIQEITLSPVHFTKEVVDKPPKEDSSVSHKLEEISSSETTEISDDETGVVENMSEEESEEPQTVVVKKVPAAKVKRPKVIKQKAVPVKPKHIEVKPKHIKVKPKEIEKKKPKVIVKKKPKVIVKKIKPKPKPIPIPKPKPIPKTKVIAIKPSIKKIIKPTVLVKTTVEKEPAEKEPVEEVEYSESSESDFDVDEIINSISDCPEKSAKEVKKPKESNTDEVINKIEDLMGNLEKNTKGEKKDDVKETEKPHDVKETEKPHGVQETEKPHGVKETEKPHGVQEKVVKLIENMKKFSTNLKESDDKKKEDADKDVMQSDGINPRLKTAMERLEKKIDDIKKPSESDKSTGSSIVATKKSDGDVKKPGVLGVEEKANLDPTKTTLLSTGSDKTSSPVTGSDKTLTSLTGSDKTLTSLTGSDKTLTPATESDKTSSPPVSDKTSTPPVSASDKTSTPATVSDKKKKYCLEDDGFVECENGKTLEELQGNMNKINGAASLPNGAKKDEGSGLTKNTFNPHEHLLGDGDKTKKPKDAANPVTDDLDKGLKSGENFPLPKNSDDPCLHCLGACEEELLPEDFPFGLTLVHDPPKKKLRKKCSNKEIKNMIDSIPAETFSKTLGLERINNCRILARAKSSHIKNTACKPKKGDGPTNIDSSEETDDNKKNEKDKEKNNYLDALLENLKGYAGFNFLLGKKNKSNLLPVKSYSSNSDDDEVDTSSMELPGYYVVNRNRNPIKN